jgi:UDP-N-acetylglucosamine acyltransferase
MAIHPTAIVHKGAEIDPSADVGPFCIVGPRVKIGPKTRLISHVVVDNDTTMGAGNIVHPFAVVGGVPQDLKFKGEPARLILGDNNVIREGVTLNIGTEAGAMETRIGSGCLLMAYAHVAHDCVLGNRVILANNAALAGHVHVADNVISGGLVGVHQFCRIGRNAFLAGGAMVAQDVPPFCIAQGDRAMLASINVVGLKRAGLNREQIMAVRQAFKQLFQGGSTRLAALEQVEAGIAKTNPLVKEMADFVRSSERGVCPPRVTGAEASDSDLD